MSLTKSLYEKYKKDCLRDIPDATPDEVEYYVQMRYQEHVDRFRYEDGDHYPELRIHQPEYDYPR